MEDIDDFYKSNSQCATSIGYKCGCEDSCGCDENKTVTQTEYSDGTITTKTQYNPVNSLFLNYELYSKAHYNHSKPLKFIGNYTGLCNNCQDKHNNCKDTYSIDVNRILRTNLESGYLCIEYTRMPLDDAGNILIIDNADLMNGLARYAIAMHWLDRSHRKEQGAIGMYKMSIQEAEILLRKAKGVFNLRNIDPVKLNHLFLGRNQLLKTNIVRNESDRYKEYNTLYNKYRF